MTCLGRHSYIGGLWYKIYKNPFITVNVLNVLKIYYTPVWKTVCIMLRGLASVRLTVIFFVSSKLLLQFTFYQAETWFIVRPWCGKRIFFRGYSPPNISRVMSLWQFLQTSFPANSYSWHPINLKLGLWLDHGVEQRIFFRDYSPPNVSRVTSLWHFFVNFSFPANSSYSLHPMKRKLDL